MPYLVGRLLKEQWMGNCDLRSESSSGKGDRSMRASMARRRLLGATVESKLMSEMQ